ncbi:ABC transporter [Bacillus canaveralius]|uniref:ABC transporter n=1 Tax=Bacillus canaveralius TaxID=1403243 RepID=UPI000F781BF1|nr:ABC transporter [Bacillus canaveralius]RSK53498.1 ABC transporter [Bacillus canaveralius]
MKELIYFIKRLYSFTGKILFINLFGMVLVSFLDGVGMLLLIPMLSIGGILEMGNTSSMLGLLDFLKDFPESIGLPFILGVYITLVIGQSLLLIELHLTRSSRIPLFHLTSSRCNQLYLE